MKRVLFVCVENSCRSQMAEAFAERLGAGRVEVRSAGSRPAARVNPRAIALMAERGYDLSGHAARSLSMFAGQTFDRVVSMGSGDACPWVPAAQRVDWALPDPKSLPDDEFRAVRDDIERRVRRLLAEWDLPS
jgi:protein-tyrosine-phosphatase